MKEKLYGLEAALLSAAETLVKPLPFGAQRALGRELGWLCWLLSPRRRLAIENARAALGVDDREARRLARAAHLHLGRGIVEFLTTSSFAEPERARLLTLEGFEHLRAAHAEGRGTFVVTGHIGSWELGALRQAMEGIPIKALGRVPKNPYFARRLAANRAMGGNEWLPANRTLLHAAKELQRGGCIAMAIDQFTRSEPRLDVEFLGRPTMVSTAVFELAVRFDCPVVPSVTYPKADGGYRIVYHEAERPAGVGERDEQVQDLARRCLRVVEGWVRAAPETWFWFHDLWKDPGAKRRQRSRRKDRSRT
jgi:KDO2-lipid IV(A) lauroyltransferase